MSDKANGYRVAAELAASIASGLFMVFVAVMVIGAKIAMVLLGVLGAVFAMIMGGPSTRR